MATRKSASTRLKMALLLVVTAGFLYFAVVVLVSSVRLTIAEQTIISWEKGKLPFEADQAGRTLDKIAQAKRQFNYLTNADLLMARLHLIISEQLSNTDTNITVNGSYDHHIEAAEEHAKIAITAQPSDFRAWTLLALAQRKKDRQSWREQQHALTVSLTIAPFEQDNQIRLLPLLIKDWSTLTSQNRELGLILITSAMSERHTAHLAVREMVAFDNVLPFRQLIKFKSLQQKVAAYLAQNDGH